MSENTARIARLGIIAALLAFVLASGQHWLLVAALLYLFMLAL